MQLRLSAMGYRTTTRDHDDRPRLDLGFLRKALPWMLAPWMVIGLVVWVLRAT